MLVKTRGLVTKAVNFGEGDKILTLLTEKYGKIQAMAKGARRTRSKLVAGTQLFCYCDFVLFKGKTWYYIDQAEIINTFHKIRNDLVTLSCCTYLMELAGEVVQPGQAPGRLLKVVLEALNLFAAGEIGPEILLRAAELKILAYAGFKPQLEHCVNCGGASRAGYFSPGSGGILCPACEKSDPYGYSISQGAISVMKLMMGWRLKKLDCLRVEQHILKELEKIMRAYVAIHIDKDFSSMRFLNSVKNKVTGRLE
ncbi:MAG: DNA repair protein RecO [Bacillota bacterium]|nr:DNA repair protein RecO [Bacillota bacterium]MDD3298770.1 DNA repair protein RecO [Bacillota bacterium]MDD3850389.1 DNA repair protein RecO [Bacillota bacterium]MDD4708016.1 DNA repair protein RecO [Bacillota bacterium]